jgi:hypothetical protein
MNTFQQAPIAVQKAAEFQQLKAGLLRVFAAGTVEKFLGRLKSQGIRARDWEAILDRRVLEDCDPELRSGTGARALYQALPVSDQGLMREFYLTEVENIDLQVREKYSKVFRYA